jgi:hypothetical protein
MDTAITGDHLAAYFAFPHANDEMHGQPPRSCNTLKFLDFKMLLEEYLSNDFLII